VATTKKPSWFSQVRDTWRLTTPADPSIKWIVPLVFIVVTAALAVGGLVIGGFGLTFTITSWAWGLLVALFVFGRRAEKAAYSQIEGVPGAAAQVLTTLKSGWFTTPAVEINRSQEIVHRLVGRPGVILIIEAKPGSAIAQSARQKTARWVGETPILEVYVGNGEGQTPLGHLTRTVRKFPKVLRPSEVTDLRRKLDAAAGGSLPIPKGPMPKGMRVPRR
jgi:hypothetical protein